MPYHAVRRAICPLLVTFALCAATAMAEGRPRRLDIVESVHGIELRDPYRWMEDPTDPDLATWLDDQAARVARFLADTDYDATRARIRELADYDLAYSARRRGDRVFHLLRVAGSDDVKIAVKQDGRTRILLTGGEVPEARGGNVTIGGTGFSGTLWPDHRGAQAIYGFTDPTGEWRLRILDTRTGRHLPESIGDVGTISGAPAWRASGDGFYYLRVATEATADGTKRTRPAGLYLHRLGTEQSEDVAVIEQAPGDRHLLVPRVSADGAWLVVTKSEGVAPVNNVLVFDARDIGAPPVELFTAANARSIFLGSDGAILYFQTSLDASRGRVVGVDLAASDEVFEVVPEATQPMLAGSNVGGDAIGYFGGLFLLGYLQDGLTDLRVYDRHGRLLRRIGLPPGSSLWGTLDAAPGERSVTVSLLSQFRPGQVVSIDLDDGSIESMLATEVPVDPDDFVVRRVAYASVDGTRVPMYVVHGRDLDLDGSHPTLVYGYGMHKWVSLLFYQPHIVHWLESGGVYAIPAIRGGGEYGDAWHVAGIRTNRQNAVDDFVAAGEWLIDEGYTSADRLAANGSSASGALAGIVPLRYGETFAASTIDYPVVDLARAHLFGNGALLVDEYGSLDTPKEARALLRQSPYHNVDGSHCFMPTLVMVGEVDKVALPFHGFKFVAQLQHAQDCDAPVLMHLMPETGHTYGVSPEAYAANTAVQITFLRKLLSGN